MTTMLAGRLYLQERGLRMETVPIPVPGPDEVLVKVRAAGVCLSDVHLIEGVLTPRLLDGDVVTLGHETAGTIEAIGSQVELWQPGQRVLLQAGQQDRRGTILTRGVDYDGGWAQYAVAREDTLVAIPDDLPFEQACIIPDAVSTPWAAITATGQARPGDPVAVWGVGGLGAHAVQLLRLIGAAPVIAVDPLEAARERALTLGADAALDPGAADFAERMGELTFGEGLAVAFDFAGVPAVRDQALRALGRGGRLVLAGIANQPVTIGSDAILNYLEQSVRGHYGSKAEHVQQLVRLARQQRLDLAGSVSAVLPLSEAPAAVERLQRKEGNPIRIVLQPW